MTSPPCDNPDCSCCHPGEGVHRIGTCDLPFPIAEAGWKWLCPECGKESVSFPLSELPDKMKESLFQNSVWSSVDLEHTFGWRREGNE